jgi:hypothetical protein
MKIEPKGCKDDAIKVTPTNLQWKERERKKMDNDEIEHVYRNKLRLY